MVMTIPYLNKIKVLSKISPPLAPPGPTSPVSEIRGAVIAIEGAEVGVARDVGRWIEDYLTKEPECAVKTWAGSISEQLRVGDDTGDAEMYGISPRSNSTGSIVRMSTADGSDTFLSYLTEIHSWHHKSNEITKFISTAPSSSSPPVVAVQPATKSPNLASQNPISPTNTSPSLSTTSNSTATAGRPSTTNSQISQRLPIALLPQGFSLNTSNYYASHIPINDSYAPVDHFQWCATLWRGIVGPDLTVYVKVVDMGNSDEREEFAKMGGVEVRVDCAAIIVRIESGGTGLGVSGGIAGGRSGAVLEERTLRRLGFEVLEYARGVAAGGEEGRGFWRR
jgi:HMG box factor